MISFRINRVFQPFHVVVAGTVLIAVPYVASNAQEGRIPVPAVVLILIGAVVLLYFVRVLILALSPYRLRITDTDALVPARVTARTFRWWGTRLRAKGARHFAAQTFQLALRPEGLTGTILLQSSTAEVVDYSRDQISSIRVRRRGLRGTEVSVALDDEPESFIFRIVTPGWLFSNEERIRESLRDLIVRSLQLHLQP